MPDRRPPAPPVSVWPAGPADLPGQLAAGGYLPGTASDTCGLPPAVAAHAVHVYTRPGDMVLDPDCGAGTVLVEAVRAGRHAVGVTGRRWWPTARANLTAAKLVGAPGDGMVLDLRPGRTQPGGSRPHRASTGTGLARPRGLAGVTGRVDLILTAIRPDRPQGGRASKRAPSDSSASDREDRLTDLLSGCVPLLRPGGHAVIVAGAIRRSGRLVDLPGILTGAARRTGLAPVDRCIALLAADVTAEPDWRPADHRPPGGTSPTERRRRHAPTRPLTRRAHLDVFVFARPEAETAATAVLPVPSDAIAAVVPSGPAEPVQVTPMPPAPGRWAA